MSLPIRDGVPKPPAPPLTRILREGGCHLFRGPEYCEKCGSSVQREWFGFGKIIGCIQPKCSEYIAHKQFP